MPISRPLWRILVLLASSPAAEGKTIVILGPSFRIFVTAIQTPAAAATIGMTQTSEIRARFWGTVLDSGTWGSDGSLSGILHPFLNFV